MNHQIILHPAILHAPLFSGITEAELTEMLGCLDAKTAVFPKGSYMLREGESVEALGLILSGSALIIQEDFWGNRNLITFIEQGQCFGETFACAPGSVSNVSVVSQTAVTVLFLNVKRLLSLCPATCAHHSQMIRNLLADFAAKNLYFNEKITHLGQRTTRARLLSYLSAEARRQGSSEFDIPYSRQQLADYLSVDRSGLSLELGKLADEGMLDFRKNHFVLRA